MSGSNGKMCNTSAGICGLALFILALLVIIGLGIWYAGWLLTEKVQTVIDENPITQVIVTISGLFVITNDFVRSLIAYVNETITLEEIREKIDSLTLSIEEKLAILFDERQVKEYANLFREKFEALVDFITRNDVDIPLRIKEINRRIAGRIFPAYQKQISEFLTMIDSNILELSNASFLN